MHTPLITTGSHPSFHLLGRDELMRLKKNAVLINCGRGPVINNQALLDVLAERDDLRVVLDVWEPEPDISLELLDKVLLGSPHIAGYSYDGKLNGTEMIYQALCRHFDKSPQLSLAELVPSLANNELRVDAITDTANNIFNIVKALINQVYDIAADDARLRSLATQAFAREAVFGEGFDGLRKHYPLRREFHNYQVHLENITESEKKWLQVLGFHCV